MTTETNTFALAETMPVTATSTEKLQQHVPQHLQVIADGGAFDVEASATRVLDAYGALEKRVGSGDLRPNDPGDYAVKVPEQLKEPLKGFGLSADFRRAAHEIGVTQRQMDFMLGEFYKTVPQLLHGGMQNSVEATRGALEKAWGRDYGRNLEGAMNAFEAYADPEDRGKFDEIMTTPALFYRLLAKIGAELGAAGEGAPSEIGSLLTSEAASNSKHPDHQAVRAKLDAYYNARH